MDEERRLVGFWMIFVDVSVVVVWWVMGLEDIEKFYIVMDVFVI